MLIFRAETVWEVEGSTWIINDIAAWKRLLNYWFNTVPTSRYRLVIPEELFDETHLSYTMRKLHGF